MVNLDFPEFTGMFVGDFPEYRVHDLANIESRVTEDELSSYLQNGYLEHSAGRIAPNIGTLYNLVLYTHATRNAEYRVLAQVQEVETFSFYKEVDDIHPPDMRDFDKPYKGRRLYKGCAIFKRPNASQNLQERKVYFVTPEPNTLLRSFRAFFGNKYNDNELLGFLNEAEAAIQQMTKLVNERVRAL